MYIANQKAYECAHYWRRLLGCGVDHLFELDWFDHSCLTGMPVRLTRKSNMGVGMVVRAMVS